MTAAFKDITIMTCCMKIIMINAFGNEEMGEDDAGVLRDTLSAFRSTFYDSCTLGEAERVRAVRQ